MTNWTRHTYAYDPNWRQTTHSGNADEAFQSNAFQTDAFQCSIWDQNTDADDASWIRDGGGDDVVWQHPSGAVTPTWNVS